MSLQRFCDACEKKLGEHGPYWDCDHEGAHTISEVHHLDLCNDCFHMGLVAAKDRRRESVP